eukprot:8980608-Alexandrium_andersonii.AAC.1
MWIAEYADAPPNPCPRTRGEGPHRPATGSGRRTARARSSTESAWSALPSPWRWGSPFWGRVP